MEQRQQSGREKVDPDNKTTGYWYYPDLQLKTYRDKRGKDTTFSYTPAKQLQSVVDPLTHGISYTYDGKGLVETVTDAAQKVTTYAYDGFGHPKLITYHDSTFRKMTNTMPGDVLTADDGMGRIVTSTWNNRRQLLTTTIPATSEDAAAVSTNTYDDSGNLQTATDFNQHVTTYTWDQLGNNLTTVLPDIIENGNALSNTLTNSYDLRDWLESTTNSSSHTVSQIYDAAHRVKSAFDPLERETKFKYDANGQPYEMTDPLERITKKSWTVRGEAQSATDGMGKTTGFIYDPNGNLTERKNRRGKTHINTYDDANRLTFSTTPGLKQTGTTYYNNDLPHVITEPSTQSTILGYNGRNQLQTKTDPTGTVSYDYDDSGLPETTTEGTNVITRTYDERGRLKTYKLTKGGVQQYLLQYRYDANGNLKRLTYPDGNHVHYTYNERNLLKTVTDWNNKVTTYHYDRLGRLTGMTRPNHTSNQIATDAAGQILSIKELSYNKAISYLGFRFDDAGQIKRRFRAPLNSEVWMHPNVTGQYDDDNQLLTFGGFTLGRDPDGNTTSTPIRADSGLKTLGYNSRNQLLSADSVTYTYDPEGNRRTIVDSTGLTRLVTDPNAPLSRLLVKHNPDNTTTRYVYGLGLLYEVADNETTKTYHFDQAGSTILRTDDDGKVIAHAEYSGYGLPIVMKGDLATPFLYNGKFGVYTDPNGLLQMRARYYSAYLMRFLNPDPSGFSGGSNWFSYADGNPISLSDPFGLCAVMSESSRDSFPSDLAAKSAYLAGAKWLFPGDKEAVLITENDGMGQDLIRFPEVQSALEKLDNIKEPYTTVPWKRQLGAIPPSEYVVSFMVDLGVYPGIAPPANSTRALVGSIAGSVYRDNEGYARIGADDTLGLASATHKPPVKNADSPTGYTYGPSGLSNNSFGWNGMGGSVKLVFDVKTYRPYKP